MSISPRILCVGISFYTIRRGGVVAIDKIIELTKYRSFGMIYKIIDTKITIKAVRQ